MKQALLLSLLIISIVSSQLWAQGRVVIGIVSADEGTGGFSGVTVVIKGTTIGTITDAKGAYSLSVPSSGTTLIFSAVGMQTLEEPIGGRTTINVLLKTDTKQLNEIVITALDVKAERDKFASSVSTLDGGSIDKTGETGLLTGLSGKASGVLITRNGGDPGAGAYIQIRGQNTINGNI